MERVIGHAGCECGHPRGEWPAVLRDAGEGELAGESMYRLGLVWYLLSRRAVKGYADVKKFNYYDESAFYCNSPQKKNRERVKLLLHSVFPRAKSKEHVILSLSLSPFERCKSLRSPPDIPGKKMARKHCFFFGSKFGQEVDGKGIHG